MAVERVLLVAPRGFCAGVEMSIKSLAWMLDAFGPPVYCYHDIVHNQRVVDRFIEKGVVFVDRIEDVPEGAPLMLSAHGSAPNVVQEAQRRTRYVVDSVCPLVTKVHNEVRRKTAQGHAIIYVGHVGHDEEVGTTAVAPAAIMVVSKPRDLDKFDPAGRPVAVLAQTTLSEGEYLQVENAARERFGIVWTPRAADRCYATTNRQEAVQRVAHRCDVFVVVGSAASSNTSALERVAREAGCLRVYRVDSRAELPDDISGTVGVTAGASAPEETVDEIVLALIGEAIDLVEQIDVVRETEHFSAPADVHRLEKRLTEEGRKSPDASFVSSQEITADAILREL